MQKCRIYVLGLPEPLEISQNERELIRQALINESPGLVQILRPEKAPIYIVTSMVAAFEDA